jgi:L-fuculose-phosphate aldolase
MPGSAEERDIVSRFATRYDVLILGNHGVIAFGDDLEQAFLRLEYCEHLAQIERMAMSMGSVRYLGWRDVEVLLDRRKAAGLGPEARGMSREEAYGLARKYYEL